MLGLFGADALSSGNSHSNDAIQVTNKFILLIISRHLTRTILKRKRYTEKKRPSWQIRNDKWFIDPSERDTFTFEMTSYDYSILCYHFVDDSLKLEIPKSNNNTMFVWCEEKSSRWCRSSIQFIYLKTLL